MIAPSSAPRRFPLLNVPGADDGVWFHDIVHTCLVTSCTPRMKEVGGVAGTTGGHGGRGVGQTKAQVARDYEVSRRWVHEFVKRFEAHGEAGPRSTPRRASPPGGCLPLLQRG
jgi:hypothetical protein